MCKLMLLVDYAKEERRDIHLKIPRNIGTFHILRRDKLAPGTFHILRRDKLAPDDCLTWQH